MIETAVWPKDIRYIDISIVASIRARNLGEGKVFNEMKTYYYWRKEMNV